MKKFFSAGLAISWVSFFLGGTQAANPELQPIPIWNATQIETICADGQNKLNQQIANLAAVPMRAATVENTLQGWSAFNAMQEDFGGPINILMNTSPDPAVRAAAEKCILSVSKLTTELFQREDLYQRLAAVNTEDPIDQKFKQGLVQSFENTGANLPPAKRKRAKAILQRLDWLQNQFAKNLRDDKTRLTFTAEEMRGLPGTYLAKARRDKKGHYSLGLSYPEYEPFMTNAENESARRRYYLAFQNQGMPQNLKLLAEAIKLRKELAQLFGLPSYAHFVTRYRMAENPQRVEDFLLKVKTAVEDAEKQEITELRELKAKFLGKSENSVTLQRWDVFFYKEKMRKARFDIDEESFRKYFPAEAGIQWALHLASTQYGIQFEPKPVPVWHPDVTFYQVKDQASGQLLGGVYLDLFPREGKYSHAAMFPIFTASAVENRLPVVALVANLSRDGFTHDELGRTLLHEFGHVLHAILSQTRYTGGLDQLEWDFVEAPSQFFEEWGQHAETLQLVPKFCKPECPMLTEAQAQRLRQASLYGRGLFYGTQRLYAAWDLAIHGEKPQDPMRQWITMQGKTPLGYVPGTHFPANFGHMMGGYAAAYYGYLWSEVLALDMLTPFGGKLLNPEVGMRFRQTVLGQGGQKPAREMVHDFLGREPSQEPFIDEITGKR